MKMNVEVKNTKKNAVETIKEITATGVSVEYFYINGIKAGVVGCSSDKDRKAFLKMLQIAVDNAETTTDNPTELIMQVQMLMSTMACCNEKEISPDKEVEIDSTKCVIDYKSKKIYELITGKELATLEDLNCELPEEAIDALLVERAKNHIATLSEEE